MLTKPLIPKTFVETKAVQMVRKAIEYAMISAYPACIVSEPGRGKTTALFYLATEFDGAYIEIGAQQKSIGGMYRGIALAIGASLGGYDRETLDSVLRQFERRARYSGANKDLLVVDEFQTLEDTTKRELLRIHETAGFALVISGNEGRLGSDRRGTARELEQVQSRIGLTMPLPNLDAEDCDLIAKAYGVSGDDALKAVRNLGTKTSARELGRTLQLAQHMTGGAAPIQLPHIRNAVFSLKGKQSALKVLDSRED
ncbi:Mu B transposition protein [Rhodobacter viridis]|uniref:Mu B transposition protein n=1 Tax=Rhodobacter viridis TaxID=1054202 RepID=A0A318TYX1_9RHOB|nr:AAA family ATPase [Rhodobacter viridis]PYF08228.1 Mu B transposition protein [Rhodobacter viridis]